MKSKTAKIAFWVSTGLIALLEGVMPALTFRSPMAVEGISHLGYPDYFGPMLTAFKVLGAIALIVPGVSARIKEWAYAGFGIDFIAAFVSIWAVDGFQGMLALPAVAFLILWASYSSYHAAKRPS